jgi:hypothetical protein
MHIRYTGFNSSYQPGARGIRRKLWYRAYAWTKSLSDFLTSRRETQKLYLVFPYALIIVFDGGGYDARKHLLPYEHTAHSLPAHRGRTVRKIHRLPTPHETNACAHSHAQTFTLFFLRTPRHPLKGLPNDTTVELSLFEAPRNLDVNGEGPAGRFEGFFRPPVTSNYTFISAADDWSMIWIGRNGSNPNQRELIIDTTSSGYVVHRDW